ncbi:MAG: hypothetical protein AAFN63_08495 [Pseudomonadota bacterium]
MSADLPWQSQTDRQLFAAVFAKTDTRALAHAVAWFSTTPVEDIGYEHHRLIAAIGRRFPDSPELAGSRRTIANIAKQLWIRANDNLRQLSWVTGYLTEVHVPWAFIGNLAWQDQKDTLFKDCDVPELMIASEAYSHIVVKLWRNGWAPPDGTDIYDISKPLLFHGPDYKQLKIWSDHWLDPSAKPDGPKPHWQSVKMQRVFHAMHPVLDLGHLQTQTLQRDMADLQWLVDLKQISDMKDTVDNIHPWWPGPHFQKRRIFHALMRA